jgi:hypothetical protein
MKGNPKDIIETLERSYESRDWSGIQLLITCLKVIWEKETPSFRCEGCGLPVAKRRRDQVGKVSINPNSVVKQKDGIYRHLLLPSQKWCGPVKGKKHD